MDGGRFRLPVEECHGVAERRHRRRCRNRPFRHYAGKKRNIREVFSTFTYKVDNMSKSTDERGRIYLPKEIRERFGERYRIVELPGHVALFPVDEDPLEGLREAIGGAFEERTADELKRGVREAISREIEEEAENRARGHEG